MKKATFDVIGTKIYLYNKFNIEVLTNTKKVKEGSAGNNHQEWKNGVWADGKRLFIPNYYFQSCIVKGGKYVKAGRGTISKNLASALEIPENKFYLNRELPKNIEDLSIEDLGTDSSREIYVDIRMVSNPNTKGKNARYRLALLPGWKTKVTILWDDTVCSKDQVFNAIEAAGKYEGVGDGRAIGYSRFMVENFELIK